METSKILRIISLVVAFVALFFAFYIEVDRYASMAGLISSLAIITHSYLLFKERKKAKESTPN